jgi:predicted transposase YdaD
MFEILDGYSVTKTREEARAEGRAEGEKRGRAEGERRGRAKGERRRNTQLIEKMLRRGDSVSEITDFLEITAKEVEAVKKRLSL